MSNERYARKGMSSWGGGGGGWKKVKTSEMVKSYCALEKKKLDTDMQPVGQRK